MTGTGVGHGLGKAAGGAAGRTTGQVVDAIMNPVGALVGFVGEATRVVGGELLDAFNPFEPDIPKSMPSKLKQGRRPAHRKRGDL